MALTTVYCRQLPSNLRFRQMWVLSILSNLWIGFLTSCNPMSQVICLVKSKTIKNGIYFESVFEECEGSIKWAFVVWLKCIFLSFYYHPIYIHRSATQSCSQPLNVKINYIQGQPTCLSKLQQIRTLLLEKDTPSANYVQEVLGHGVLAGIYFTSIMTSGSSSCFCCL